jgi:hypothetical protein
MIASVHVADLGARSALGALRTSPKPRDVPGLRHANVGLAAPLSGRLRPTPHLGRAGLVAFWDDDVALDKFLSDHPLAKKLAGGWHLRLAPLRMHGTWPGVPDDIPKQRNVEHQGPAAVLTLGRLKFTRTLPFFRTSAKAEGRVVEAPGLIWTTAIAKPPFVSTCSLWEDSSALSTYAYGPEHPQHSDAIATDRAKGFHHQSAFIRFRPYDSVGHLDGKNPLPEQSL